MNIQLDVTKMNAEFIPVLIAPSHQLSETSARIDGISLPDVPILKRTIADSVIGFGTITVGEPLDLGGLQDLKVHIGLPASEARSLNLAEQYARLKEEIVAAGIPLLSDEELRAEIRERRGVRSESLETDLH